MDANDHDNNRKRGAPSAILSNESGTMVITDGKVGAMVNHFDTPSINPTDPLSHVHVHDPKRMKVGANENADDIISGKNRRVPVRAPPEPLSVLSSNC
jgi:hypothetical protein